MVKLTYTINSGTRETRAAHRGDAPPDLHPEVGDVGRARPVVVIIPLGEYPHDLIDATLKREIPPVTRARLAGLVNQTDFTHDNDFLIGCTMATGRGFLRAPPFPASPFACPVPVSLRSCNRSIQLRNVCDAPGISIPAYAGRSLAAQSIIHYSIPRWRTVRTFRYPFTRLSHPFTLSGRETRPGGLRATIAARTNHGAGSDATQRKGNRQPDGPAFANPVRHGPSVMASYFKQQPKPGLHSRPPGTCLDFLRAVAGIEPAAKPYFHGKQKARA